MVDGAFRSGQPGTGHRATGQDRKRTRFPGQQARCLYCGRQCVWGGNGITSNLRGGDFSLAQVAALAGFSDQSQFSRHFKRIVGVTPGRFRTPARFA
jgi:AraC-like DNA-binding protein